MISRLMSIYVAIDDLKDVHLGKYKGKIKKSDDEQN